MNEKQQRLTVYLYDDDIARLESLQEHFAITSTSSFFRFLLKRTADAIEKNVLHRIFEEND